MGIPGDPQKFQQSIDALVRSLFPGSISLHASRIDTKDKHSHRALYEADHCYFVTTRKQSFIRAARCGEFDYSPSNDPFMERYPDLAFQSASMPSETLRAMWKEIPRLWVLVTDHGNGTHHVSSVYRGAPLWAIEYRDGSETAQFKSNDDLCKALETIQACEGFDMPAWKQFLQRYWDACVFDAAVTEKGAAIH